MGAPALTVEETKSLATTVKGERLDLHNRRLIRLSHLRLNMLQGTTSFVPTALGYDWYRQYMEEAHGDG